MLMYKYIIIVLVISQFFLLSCSDDNIRIDAKIIDNVKWGIEINENLREDLTSQQGGFALAIDDWLYFSQVKSGSIVNSNGELYRMRFDGSNIEKILDIPCKYMRTDGTLLYFVDVENNGQLKSLNIDTQEVKVLYSERPVGGFEIVDGIIYFASLKETAHTCNINRINIDSSGFEALITEKECSLPVYDDGYIYYTDMGFEFEINKLDLKTMINETLGSDYSIVIGKSGKKIITKNSSPAVYDVETNQYVTLFPERVKQNIASFNFYNEYIIYTTSDGMLMSFDGEEEIILYKDFFVSNMVLVDNWAFLHVSKDVSNPSISSLLLYNLLTKEITYFD